MVKQRAPLRAAAHHVGVRRCAGTVIFVITDDQLREFVAQSSSWYEVRSLYFDSAGVSPPEPVLRSRAERAGIDASHIPLPKHLEGHSTKRTGDRSETMALAALSSCDYPVSIPFGDNARYDLVAEIDGELLRVQVKSGRVIKGTIYFKTASQHYHRGCTSRDYRGDADLFAVYTHELRQVHLVPVEAVGRSGANLRLQPPRNNQSKRIRYASDFLLWDFCSSSL